MDGVVYNYYYVGSQLSRMTYGTTVLDFFYDATGVPIAMREGSTTSSSFSVYYYITNLQGDVIQLVDADGKIKAHYDYEPYGGIILAIGTHATINPLRYRGYVYDSETGFYYLQSRYYDPRIGRFINADAYASTGQGLLGNNMFAYCGNNPVTRVDFTGFGWVDFWEGVRKWLEEEKEEAKSNRDDTKTTGLTLAGAFSVGGSISAGFTKDTKGNVGVSFTLNGGGGFPSAGVGMFHSVNNAPTIYHQRGMGTAIGGSGGPAVIAVGGEYNTIIDKENGCAYHGGTIAITYGLYPTVVEVHGEVGNTWVAGINLYDKAIELVDFLLGIQER